MEIIRGIHNIRVCHRSCVLSMGNFDGIHQGHQVLLEQLKLEGKKRNLPVVVIIFEPQPQEFLVPLGATERLTRFRDKCYFFSKMQIDFLLCMRFNEILSMCDAHFFITSVLVKKLGIKLLLMGDDFHFGLDRKGDYELLCHEGKKYGFVVRRLDPFCQQGQRISSSIIRSLLKKGDLETAQLFLGRPYSISGKIIHGDGGGRLLGFPTANIALKGLTAPLSGVYFVRVYGIMGYSSVYGVANIGNRPTVEGKVQQFEVHILGISMNLYGRYLRVIFIKKLRDEKRFPSLEALRKQISQDIAIAMRLLN